MRLKKVTSLAGAFTLLCGCSNALYFYETEKIAMSLQGRPDSSQPVQGSLGLKQRVAVVAPPKDPDTTAQARSDAVSMVSTFRFRKDEGGFADLGPVTIQTAFVTGSAATALKEKAPAVARAQVTGVRTVGPEPPDIHARKKRLTDCVTDISDNTKLNAIAKKLGITPNIDDPNGTKISIKTRIGELLPEELEELGKSDELKSCPQ
jgi:hypothetical protein